MSQDNMRCAFSEPRRAELTNDLVMVPDGIIFYLIKLSINKKEVILYGNFKEADPPEEKDG